MADLADWSFFFSFKPTWPFKQFVNLDKKIVFLSTGNQCLDKDEFIYTKNGIKKVSELKVGDDTLSGKILNISSFEDDIYEITFQTGHKIRVNQNHPFYWKKYKSGSSKPSWKRTHEIEDGYVQFVSSDLVGEEIENPRLLGYLMSDGYIKEDQSLKFTNKNKCFLDDVEKLSTSLGYTCTYEKNGYTFTIKYDQSKTHPLKKYILDLGYGSDSFGKIINGTKDSIKEFLIGYFNGDGYMLIRNRKSGYGKLPSIEVGFCIGLSKRKAYEFQYMLWRLGIYSYVVKEFMKKSTGLFYRVKVNSFSVQDIIDIIEHTKYPEKFARVIDIIKQNKYKRIKERDWIHVKKIEHVGRGTVVGYECEGHEVISYGGMRTHNSMKTASAAYSYVLRILGMHPIEKKNIRPNDPIRIFRFSSETLPNEAEGKEVRNTQYPEFKKWLPPSLIKKDITIRKPVMTLLDPQGGPDIYVEFTSFNQDTQAQAGVQRKSVWIDEHAPKQFYEEQLPRLLAADGDIVYTLTPAQEHLDWEYDEIYERADVIVRSDLVLNRILQRTGEKLSQFEYSGNKNGIGVIMAATDDNPTLTKEVIDDMFALFADDDVVDIRRYGLFKQISGKIYKQFDKRIHVISANDYFANGIPHTWVHARGIDYHEQNPWAVGWISMSPTNEAFIWNEFNPSPNTYITSEVAKEIAEKSGDKIYYLNLIDPLAAKKQSNTNRSVIEDMNEHFAMLRREGIGTGGYWQSWDTKNLFGREEIRTRLWNSRIVGRPFNNKITKSGHDQYLPTIWILDTCPLAIEYMNNWRKEEWSHRDANLSKDSKDNPQQKWSHFNMVWEAVFKHPGFSIGRFREPSVPRHNSPFARR